MKTYYDILHVTENADISVIDATYRALNKQHYQQGTQDSTEFASIQHAYECLSDPERRAKYDAKLKGMNSGGASDAKTPSSSVADAQGARNSPADGSRTSNAANGNSTTTSNSAVSKSAQKSFYQRNEVGVWIGVVVVVIFIIGNSCTYTWTKVDIAEHAETFHEETYYSIEFADFDLCSVGTDWTDCINALVDNYNQECVNKSISDNLNRCQNRKDKIDRMKGQSHTGECSDAYYWGECTVVSGDFKGLRGKTKTEKVSNNDHTPAKTHEATCTWGLWGECK